MTDELKNVETSKTPQESAASNLNFTNTVCGMTINDVNSAITQLNLSDMKAAEGHLPAVDFCTDLESLTPKQAADGLAATGSAFLDKVHIYDPAATLEAIEFQFRLDAASAKGSEYLKEMFMESGLNAGVSIVGGKLNEYVVNFQTSQDEGELASITGYLNVPSGQPLTVTAGVNGEDTRTEINTLAPGMVTFTDRGANN